MRLCTRVCDCYVRNGGFNKRWYSKRPEVTHGLSCKPDPTEVTQDYIGPPDKDSNLRPIVRHIPKNEPPLTKELRLKRIEVEKWNQDFWFRHNKRFYEDKELFIKLQKSKGMENISADTMSEFYKNFLDKNWQIHFLYNVSWYVKNFSLLMLSTRVNIVDAWRKLRRRNDEKANE